MLKSIHRYVRVTGQCTLREVRKESHDCRIAYRFAVNGQAYASRPRIVLWEERGGLPQAGDPVTVFHHLEFPTAHYCSYEKSFMDRGGRTSEEAFYNMCWLPCLVAGIFITLFALQGGRPMDGLRRYLMTVGKSPDPVFVGICLVLLGGLLLVPVAVGLGLIAYAWHHPEETDTPLYALGGAIALVGLWLSYPGFIDRKPDPGAT